VQFVGPSHGLCLICTWTPLFWAVLFGENYEPTHRSPCSHGNSSIERWKVLITQISVVTHRNNFSSPGVWLLSVTLRVHSRRDVTEGITLRVGSYILFENQNTDRNQNSNHTSVDHKGVYSYVFGPSWSRLARNTCTALWKMWQT